MNRQFIGLPIASNSKVLTLSLLSSFLFIYTHQMPVIAKRKQCYVIIQEAGEDNKEPLIILHSIYSYQWSTAPYNDTRHLE